MDKDRRSTAVIHEKYSLGVMSMPAGFRYRDVFLKGRPKHDRFDSFRIKHP